MKEERKERVRDRWACRVANLSDLNLTDEQKTKIAEIRQEYRPKVHEAGNKLRAAAREEVAQNLGSRQGMTKSIERLNLILATALGPGNCSIDS